MKTGNQTKPGGSSKTGKKKLLKNIRINLDSEEAGLIMTALYHRRLGHTPTIYGAEEEAICTLEMRILQARAKVLGPPPT